jgi:hypothetical protein
LFSYDKVDAFFGIDGWRTGFLTWFFAAFCALMISISDIEIQNGIIKKYFIPAVLVVPVLMFILGIINRFGIYPMNIFGQDETYLATLGNINWYAGFLSIFVPLGTGLCYVAKRFSLSFFLLSAYELLGFMALFLQGSESAFLILAGQFSVLIYHALKDRESFMDLLCQLFILGLAMEISGLMFLIFRESFTYEESGLIILCEKHIGLVIVAVSLCLYRLACLMREIKFDWKRKLFRSIYFIILSAGVICAIAFLISNFDDSFGNGRGIIWKISGMILAKESLGQKLVGIGQDCYFIFSMNQEEIAQLIYETFEGARLTNAHCEPFTLLIQTGVLGCIAFYGMIVTALVSLIKKAKQPSSRAAVIFALPIACYVLNNMVSFSQPTSTPYLFICLGLGISLLQKSKQDNA